MIYDKVTKSIADIYEASVYYSHMYYNIAQDSKILALPEEQRNELLTQHFPRQYKDERAQITANLVPEGPDGHAAVILSGPREGMQKLIQSGDIQGLKPYRPASASDNQAAAAERNFPRNIRDKPIDTKRLMRFEQKDEE